MSEYVHNIQALETCPPDPDLSSNPTLHCTLKFALHKDEGKGAGEHMMQHDGHSGVDS